jgi:putative tryptophan/tyrosine transport system substrate-binding protein
VSAPGELVVVAALHAVKNNIPTVFAGVSDPVGSGFVESLARPGGNLTGFTNFESEIGGKWVQALKEIAPQVSRALFLHHPPPSVPCSVGGTCTHWNGS